MKEREREIASLEKNHVELEWELMFLANDNNGNRKVLVRLDFVRSRYKSYFYKKKIKHNLMNALKIFFLLK